MRSFPSPAAEFGRAAQRNGSARLSPGLAGCGLSCELRDYLCAQLGRGLRLLSRKRRASSFRLLIGSGSFLLSLISTMALVDQLDTRPMECAAFLLLLRSTFSATCTMFCAAFGTAQLWAAAHSPSSGANGCANHSPELARPASRTELGESAAQPNSQH